MDVIKLNGVPTDPKVLGSITSHYPDGRPITNPSHIKAIRNAIRTASPMSLGQPTRFESEPNTAGISQGPGVGRIGASPMATDIDAYLQSDDVNHLFPYVDSGSIQGATWCSSVLSPRPLPALPSLRDHLRLSVLSLPPL